MVMLHIGRDIMTMMAEWSHWVSVGAAIQAAFMWAHWIVSSVLGMLLVVLEFTYVNLYEDRASQAAVT